RPLRLPQISFPNLFAAKWLGKRVIPHHRTLAMTWPLHDHLLRHTAVRANRAEIMAIIVQTAVGEARFVYWLREPVRQGCQHVPHEDRPHGIGLSTPRRGP